MGKVLPGILTAQLEICFQYFQQIVNGQPARLRSRERARADHIRADFPQAGFQNLFGGLWVRALGALAEFLAAQIVGNPENLATLENPSVAAHITFPLSFILRTAPQRESEFPVCSIP